MSRDRTRRPGAQRESFGPSMAALAATGGAGRRRCRFGPATTAVRRCGLEPA